ALLFYRADARERGCVPFEGDRSRRAGQRRAGHPPRLLARVLRRVRDRSRRVSAGSLLSRQRLALAVAHDAYRAQRLFVSQAIDARSALPPQITTATFSPGERT